MTYHFPLNGRLIPVEAILTGPLGQVELRMALDTGATQSLIDPDVLELCGYDLSKSSGRVRLNTSSGTVDRSSIRVFSLYALGVTHDAFPCVAGALPKRSAVRGLLGLDHFEGRKLLLDFSRGRIVVGGRMALLW
jgi:hypothetical protein